MILEFYANSKLGPALIPGDPYQQTINGKTLAGIIERQNLIIGNSSNLAMGLITRHRTTVNGEENSGKAIIEEEIAKLNHKDGDISLSGLWKLKQKIFPRAKDSSVAMMDANGHLVSSEGKLNNLYLETGCIPVKSIILKRRLLYYYHIIKRPKYELIYKVYKAQKLKPCKFIVRTLVHV